MKMEFNKGLLETNIQTYFSLHSKFEKIAKVKVSFTLKSPIGPKQWNSKLRKKEQENIRCIQMWAVGLHRRGRQ